MSPLYILQFCTASYILMDTAPPHSSFLHCASVCLSNTSSMESSLLMIKLFAEHENRWPVDITSAVDAPYQLLNLPATQSYMPIH